MMHAIHIELLPQMIESLHEEATAKGVKTGDKDVWANSEEFTQAVMRAGFECPLGAAGVTDSRFRLFLKIPGKQEFNGVYYVSGWHDKGTVSLSWDPDQEHIVPRRREAIMATRAKG
jgi:hypothetical protein